MRVQAEIPVYELNGKELTGSARMRVRIDSHWCYRDRVVLVSQRVGGGEVRLTVLADDLKRAIDAAQLARR